MTTPRLVSLTALAASLFIVVVTITQANGLAVSPHLSVSGHPCPATGPGCTLDGWMLEASFAP